MFEKEYHSSVNFGGHPKSGLEIPSGYAISGEGRWPYFVYTHIHKTD